jgi:hypothetical protein
LSPIQLCEADASDDEEIASDSMTTFVQARLLDPETKNKTLQVLSLHQIGESFKTNLYKPVKKYVKSRNERTANDWSLGYQG